MDPRTQKDRMGAKISNFKHGLACFLSIFAFPSYLSGVASALCVTNSLVYSFLSPPHLKLIFLVVSFSLEGSVDPLEWEGSIPNPRTKLYGKGETIWNDRGEEDR